MHCLLLSLTDRLTNSLTDYRLVNLIDEDANSKLVGLFTVADSKLVGFFLLLQTSLTGDPTDLLDV